MQNTPNINLNDLVHQIHILCPHTISDNEESDLKIRQKLEEQLIQKSPQVELEHLDLKYIIMNVKKSLSEFQKRIDESVAQQQLRRTTRVRKTIHQDPDVINFFSGNKLDRKVFPSAIIKSDLAQGCSNSKCSHKISDLNEIVQVESLPISASTNLLTIFIPSILQEKLHSCKYKISIDLNRLDLTKQILDLNVEQQVNSNQETNKKHSIVTNIEASEKCDLNEANELNITCEIKDDKESENKAESMEKNIATNIPENIIATTEVKEKQENEESVTAVESAVSFSAETEVASTNEKKRGRKRLESKKPSNDPPKKRGRKPGSKNKKKDEKSELAKYVEMFACNASSPSALSQIVTSTTQNWDMPEQNGQIAYFMNGEWTLSAPSNNSHPLVSTTNNVVNLDEAAGGQETFIPFEDFVNFIENPSLDGGSNVIARVLDGAGETAPSTVNSQESDAIKFSVEIPLNTKSNLNSQVNQSILSSTNFDEGAGNLFNRCNNRNMVHSTANDKEIDINDEILDLSKDHNSNTDPKVLDLTRDSSKKIVSSSAYGQNVQQTNNKESKTVIFSTGRNMPSLDDMDTDLFCSPHQTEHTEKSVIFSTIPTTPSFTPKCLRSPNDSIADSAIEVESKDSTNVTESSRSTATLGNDKTKSELMKGMSLLEIERDIDDSLLDFENCMDDDLLSLAPSSCFNSPTEDRLAESSILEVDETNIGSSVCTNSVIHSNTSLRADNYVEIDVSNNKEEEHSKRRGEETLMKNFRIPRKRSKDGFPATVQFGNKVSEISDIEKMTIVTSSSANTGANSCNRFSISSSQLSTVKTSAAISSRDASKLFGPVCYNFLVDKCFEISCKLSHQLLEPSAVKTSLVHLQDDVLHSSYRFIWRHYKLFKLYFSIFCEEYARRNMRRKLSNMITDCEMQSNCQHLLRNIYSVLIACGLNKVNACRFILNRSKESCSAVIDVLMEIIIESGAAMFSVAIDKFALIPNYRFKMKDINALAAACLHSGSAELITVLMKCLINVDQVEFITFRSSELIQILEMVKNGGVNGL